MGQWWLRKAGLLWAQWAIKKPWVSHLAGFSSPSKVSWDWLSGYRVSCWNSFLALSPESRSRWHLRLQGKELTQPVYRYFVHVFTLTAAICWVCSLFLSLFSVSTLVSSCDSRNLGHTCPEYLPDFGDVEQTCCAFPGVSLLCVELRKKI